MQFIIRSILFCAMLALFVSCALSSKPTTPPACSMEEHKQMPCVCCKKDCWYTVAAAATHELGHMPGEAGEREALATLRLIRACMISDCAGVCLARVPF